MSKTPKGAIGLYNRNIDFFNQRKKTSIGRNHSMIGTSSLNKHKRRSYKKYRGQGK
jgi:hypothetical protein|tara:strand:+ start:546 stop:713 length:168 start_codon:yes stop_codon:yes gene_type:complete